MQYIRQASALCAIVPTLLTIGGCAGDAEYARGIARDQAIVECRKLPDASAHLDCKKRAEQMHAPR